MVASILFFSHLLHNGKLLEQFCCSLMLYEMAFLHIVAGLGLNKRHGLEAMCHRGMLHERGILSIVVQSVTAKERFLSAVWVALIGVNLLKSVI